jgi:hypothetical protein
VLSRMDRFPHHEAEKAAEKAAEEAARKAG